MGFNLEFKELKKVSALRTEGTDWLDMLWEKVCLESVSEVAVVYALLVFFFFFYL